MIPSCGIHRKKGSLPGYVCRIRPGKQKVSMSGLFDLINIPFSYVIKFFYSLTDNYMIALLGFAVVVKVVLFPIGIKSQKNMVKQATLRPKEMAIRAKYAGRTDQATQQKMQQEVMTLYQNEKYNPASGCLPMLLQLIVVWAIYQIVYGPLTYLCSMSADGVSALKTAVMTLNGVDKYTGNEITLLGDITKLGISAVIECMKGLEGVGAELVASVEDILVNHWPNMTVFGGKLDLTETPTVALNILLLIPLLNLFTTFASTKITRKLSYQAPSQEAGQADASMKIMEYAMPLMIFWMAFQLPAALGVYWIFQNLLGVAQQFILYKMYPYPTFTEEEMKAAQKAVAASAKQERKASEQKAIRSLHHIDDDDYPEPQKKSQSKNGKKPSAPAEEAPAPEEATKEAPEADESENAPASVIGRAPLKEDKKDKK